jgi:hypothetical protein
MKISGLGLKVASEPTAAAPAVPLCRDCRWCRPGWGTIFALQPRWAWPLVDCI